MLARSAHILRVFGKFLWCVRTAASDLSIASAIVNPFLCKPQSRPPAPENRLTIKGRVARLIGRELWGHLSMCIDPETRSSQQWREDLILPPSEGRAIS